MLELTATFALAFLLVKTLQGQPSGGLNQFNNIDDNSSYVAKCVFRLLKKYAQSGEFLSGSVVSIALSRNQTSVQREFLKAINSDFDLKLTLIVKNLANDVDVDFENPEKPQCYFAFLNTNDDEDLINILEDWKSEPNWNPTAQFVLYVVHATSTVRIIETCIQMNVLNVNVIALDATGCLIETKTIFPYDNENNCGTAVVSVDVLDVCRVQPEVQIDEIRRGLFVDKFPNDMQMCPLKAYARIWEPYTFYSDQQKFFAGIDYLLVKTMASHLNFSYEVILHNKTLYHIFQKLIESTIELVIGGIDEDPNISNYVSGTIPYYQDELTWCVARAERNFHWLNFITSFTPITWFLIYVSTYSAVFAIYAIHYVLRSYISIPLFFSRISNDIIGAVHSQSIRIRYNQVSIRIILACVFVFALIVDNAYQAFLVSSLTRPSNQYQIKSVQDLYEKSIRVTGTVEVIRHLNKNNKIFEYIRQNFEMCYFIEDCLRRVATDPTLAVAVSRQHLFYNPRIPRDRLFCFDRDENIYSYFVSILTPKNYHLLKKLNPLIQQLIESGHIIKWTQDVDNQRTINEMLKANVDISGQNLTIHQMQGPFILLVIMLSFAAFAFIVEFFVWTRITNILLKFIPM